MSITWSVGLPQEHAVNAQAVQVHLAVLLSAYTGGASIHRLPPGGGAGGVWREDGAEPGQKFGQRFIGPLTYEHSIMATTTMEMKRYKAGDLDRINQGLQKRLSGLGTEWVHCTATKVTGHHFKVEK